MTRKRGSTWYIEYSEWVGGKTTSPARNLTASAAPRVFSGICDNDAESFAAGSAPAARRYGTNPAQARRFICARLVARAYAAVRR